MEGSSIGRVQCSFEINQDRGVILLYDRSNNLSTQVSGENAVPFEYGCFRRVVIQKKLNTVIGIGGKGCDLVRFELYWHLEPVEITEKVKNNESRACGQKDNPRLVQTVDKVLTELPS
jgi:hypothetical protein